MLTDVHTSLAICLYSIFLLHIFFSSHCNRECHCKFLVSSSLGRALHVSSYRLIKYGTHSKRPFVQGNFLYSKIEHTLPSLFLHIRHPCFVDFFYQLFASALHYSLFTYCCNFHEAPNLTGDGLTATEPGTKSGGE